MSSAPKHKEMCYFEVHFQLPEMITRKRIVQKGIPIAPSLSVSHTISFQFSLSDVRDAKED